MHCVKSVRIRSLSGPYFSAFELNTERQGPKKSSEYGHFLRSDEFENLDFLDDIDVNDDLLTKFH